MKSMLKSVALLSILTAGISLNVGCDNNNDRVGDPADTARTAGQEVDDKALTAKVKAAIDADNVKFPDVKVATYKGVVQLSGFADTREQKNRAEELAKNVPNVSKVENNITVKDTKNP